MAVKSSETIYLDDLDGKTEGTEAGGFVPNMSFSHDGQYFEIDLTKENAAAFAKVLQKYKDKGRKVEAPKNGGPGGVSPELKEWRQRVMAWAKKPDNTFVPVKPKGGYPSAEIAALYVTHHPDDPKPGDAVAKPAEGVQTQI